MSEPEELLGFALEALDEIDLRDRIAHQSLSQLDADLLWRVSTERVSELRAILVGLRSAGQ